MARSRDSYELYLLCDAGSMPDKPCFQVPDSVDTTGLQRNSWNHLVLMTRLVVHQKALEYVALDTEMSLPQQQ